ncbi:hypothetical protein [Bombiscardovia coagulans]|uniref:Uncharacterized protein n=1 Tax=Bombiscardovia coagulans TaxID=686666 RepID=A0A261ESU3_9BIFI|nr:hypothetical protein [Bombiscardovia coagulans]OZG49895.1 hypothetical protein BOCO_0412 [Bombiscardovia coagulans]
MSETEYEVDRATGETWHSHGEGAAISHEIWADDPALPSLNVTKTGGMLCVELYTEHGSMNTSISVTNTRRLAQWILEHTSEEEA